MEDKVIFEVHPAPARRGLALVFMIVLAFMLIYTAITLETGFLYRVLLLVLGVVTMMGARSMARGTRGTVQLKKSGLYLSDGTVLADIDNVEKVERGLFAFKPSNGFAVKLKSKQPGAFVPGMFWRIGKTVGVGGVLNAGASKAMADMMAGELTPYGADD